MSHNTEDAGWSTGWVEKGVWRKTLLKSFVQVCSLWLKKGTAERTGTVSMQVIVLLSLVWKAPHTVDDNPTTTKNQDFRSVWESTVVTYS